VEVTDPAECGLYFTYWDHYVKCSPPAGGGAGACMGGGELTATMPTPSCLHPPSPPAPPSVPALPSFCATPPWWARSLVETDAPPPLSP